MIENIKLKIMGESRTVTKGITLLDIAKDYQEKFKYPIVLAKVGNHYRELTEVITSNEDVFFLDLVPFCPYNLIKGEVT